MKHRTLLLALALIITLTGASCKKSGQPASDSMNSMKENSFEFYELSSARVHYTYEGIINGTEELVFVNHGEKQARRQTTQVSLGNLNLPSGVEIPKQERLLLTDKDTVYTIDLAKKEGIKISNTSSLLTQDPQMYAAKGKDFLQQLGAESEGTKTVAGKTCDVWTLSQQFVQLCLYKGVALETRVTTPGANLAIIADSIEENANVDASELEIPAGVNITDQGDLNSFLEKNVNPF